jgi:hypothetical protein
MNQASPFDHPLVTTLQIAVPMWIAEANLRHGETRAELLADWRDEALPVIAYQGDVLLYGKNGGPAKVFNSLARGLAALACHQGGVNAFGLIWCAEHCPGGAIEPDEFGCTQCLVQYPHAPRGCSCCIIETRRPPDLARSP